MAMTQGVVSRSKIGDLFRNGRAFEPAFCTDLRGRTVVARRRRPTAELAALLRNTPFADARRLTPAEAGALEVIEFIRDYDADPELRSRVAEEPELDIDQIEEALRNVD